MDNTPLRSQLVIAPVNGSLDLSADGSFTYTPNAGFEGVDSFIYVVPNGSVSRFGQVRIDVQTEETGPFVNIRLVATDTQGDTLTDAIQVGDEFLLQFFAEDTSPLPQEGVFAAYADIEWQSTLATVNGAIQYSDDYEFGRRGDTSTPGLVDEAGAFHRDTSFTGDSERLLTIPLTATGPGVIEFTTNPADVLPFGNILLFDTDEAAVPLDLIVFGSTTVEVEGVPVPVANPDSYDATNGLLTVSAANGVLTNDLGPNGGSIQASLESEPGERKRCPEQRRFVHLYRRSGFHWDG